MRSVGTIVLVMNLAGCSPGLVYNPVPTVLLHGANGQQAVNSWPKLPRPDSAGNVRGRDHLVTLGENQADQSQSQSPASLDLWVNGATQARIHVAGRWIVVTGPLLDSLGILHGTVRRVVGPKRLWGFVQLPVDEHSESGVELPLMDIDILQLPAGSWAAEGAVIGATAGAAVGLAVGAVVTEMDLVNDGIQWDGAAGAAAFLGVVGAAVGALKGSESKKWKTIYLRTAN